MGYTTDFHGSFQLSRPLTTEESTYLRTFCETRRMKRDASKTAKLPDSIRKDVALPVGVDGEFYVGGDGFMGQDITDDVLDHNSPPSTQPGLWCHWVPTQDNDGIEWDGSEKFYHYVEWLKYIMVNFLQPWGVTLDGAVEFQGEDHDDRGIVSVEKNTISINKYTAPARKKK